MYERDGMLRRPSLGIGHLQRSIAVGLQHFGPDHDRHSPCSTCKTNGQLGVPLSPLKTVLGFPTHRNVAGRSEFLPKCSDGLCLVRSLGQDLLRQFGEAARGEGAITVGDASESIAVVDGEGEGRARIVLQIIGAQGMQDRMCLQQGRCSVEVLQVRHPEGFTDFVSNRQKQQSTALLSKPAHRRRVSGKGGEEEVGFPLAVLGVKDAHGFASRERGECCLQTRGHVYTLGLSFKKGRIGTLSPDLVTP